MTDPGNGGVRGRVAVVTGGSRGIGRAIALRLAEQGARVIIGARDEGDLAGAVAEAQARGLRLVAVAADVGTEAGVRRLADRALEETGGIDILVNNAGIGVFKPALEMTVEEFDRMWAVNMRGVFLMTKAVLPAMIAGGGGDLVNIASLAGKNTFAGGAGYAATKWALRGFAGCLMLEVRKQNVRVITICPGSVDTNFSSMNLRGDAITQPGDIADAVLFAVTAPRRSMISEIDVRPTIPQ